MFTKSFVLFPQFKFCGGLCLQKLISSAPRNNYKQQFVVKYKEITSKSTRYYKKVRVGALADQEMGLTAPSIPQLLIPALCARLIFTIIMRIKIQL